MKLHFSLLVQSITFDSHRFPRKYYTRIMVIVLAFCHVKFSRVYPRTLKSFTISPSNVFKCFKHFEPFIKIANNSYNRHNRRDGTHE